MEAIDGVDLTYANVAETLASDWMQHQIVPREMRVRSARLLNVLEPLASELGITLSSAKKLPAVKPGQEVYDRAPWGMRNYIFENHRIVNDVVTSCCESSLPL